MAKAFENTFQWSHTRARTFHVCKRLYYYSYYAYWGGWDPHAPPDVRMLYLLKKMVSIPMWTGSIVHRCIEHAIKSARVGTIIGVDELKVMALKLLASGWVDSRSGAWKTEPKKAVNLAEHYYRQQIDPEAAGAVMQRTMASIEAFHRSAVFQHVCADPASVLAVEEMMTFTVETVPVIMVADLVLTMGDECHIYDWKSGGVAPLVADQLAVYALGAMMRWKYAQEKVRVYVAYLGDDTVREVTCTVHDIVRIRDTITDTAAAMLSFCGDTGRNTPRPRKDYPLCRDASVCSSCAFRQVCMAELIAEEDGAFFLTMQKLKDSASLP
jgi:hypothetical protein